MPAGSIDPLHLRPRRELVRKFVLLLTIICGCAPAIHSRLMSFNEAEYAPYSGAGTASIYGEAFLKTRGGDVKKGAGNKVFMNPVTSYSTEWYQRQIIGGQILEQPDQRALPFFRETIADSDGRFEFQNLPAGEYYLACPITWEVPIGYGNMMPTGGFAHGRIKVEPGERVRVILTR